MVIVTVTVTTKMMFDDGCGLCGVCNNANIFPSTTGSYVPLGI